MIMTDLMLALIALIMLGLVIYLVETYIPLSQPIQPAIHLVVVLVLCLWLLSLIWVVPGPIIRLLVSGGLMSILHSPILHGAVSGALAAAAVDFHAFKNWQTVDEVIAYNWTKALVRWAYGALMGAVTAAGFGVV